MSPPLTTPVLTIAGLRVEAPNGAVLVDNVDLRLNPGEVMGLIGESGAGKSTIGLAAMAYGRGGCRIAGGRIELGGAPLLDLDKVGRAAYRGARIAYVAQSAAAAFNPAHPIGKQIMEGPRQHALMSPAEARAWMMELLHALDLPDPEAFAKRYPHQVSGGQLQRAMVAMAMSCRPDILVLDEPTTALDVTTQIEVLILLRRLVRQYRTAALYITHDLAVVAQIADRIMVLRHGKMVEEGSAAEVLENPTAPYTRKLVAEREHAHNAHAAPAHEGETLLKVENVTAAYGTLPVLKNVSIELHRGETLALVGESGSGKSTLGRAIVGLLAPREGEVSFRGRPLARQYLQRDKDVLRRIQLVYQLPDVALNPRQTIAEIIGRPLAFYFGMKRRQRAERVAELLRLIGLPEDFALRLPGALSGGQKQRVCIARALAAEPDVIICDEVTSALDPLVAEEILGLLRDLQQRLDLAYLFITHDLGVVHRLAHRTAVMQRGAILEQGPTDTVFQPPHHPYTEQLLSSVPEMRRDWLDGVLVARGRATAVPVS